MAYVRTSLVQGTGSAIGTGNATLTDVTGFASFSTIADASTVHYAIQESPASALYEFGLATKTTTGGSPVLQRTAGNVLGGSSGSGTLVNFSGTKQVVYVAPLGEVQVVPNVAADPSVSSLGQTTYRTDTNRIRVYQGASAAWGNVVQENIANTFTLGPQTIQTGADGNIGVAIQANSGTQSADLQDWQTSAGNPRARITSKCEFSNPKPNDCSGTLNEAFGSTAGAALSSGGSNTLMGNAAGTALTTGGSNVAVGKGALTAETTGSFQVAIGVNALATANGASNQIAVGINALQFLTTGSLNCAMGPSALRSVVTGTNNVGLGTSAGAGLTGAAGSNLAIGTNALSAGGDVGTGNVAIGGGSMTGVGGNACSNNTAIGDSSLKNITTGSSNVCIGRISGTGLAVGGTAITTATSNTLLGYATDCVSATQSQGTALGIQAVCQANELALSPYTNFQTFYVYDSTVTLQPRADFNVTNIDNTHATRKYHIDFRAWDTAARIFMSGEASGSVAKWSVFGAAVVVQPSTTGTTQQTAAGVGTAIKTDSTSTGGTGSTAYTTADVILALKQVGILAA